MSKRRVAANDLSWHEARMAEGPQGWLRERGIKSWDQLHDVALAGTEAWEMLPYSERIAYAFRNPEDR